MLEGHLASCLRVGLYIRSVESLIVDITPALIGYAILIALDTLLVRMFRSAIAGSNTAMRRIAKGKKNIRSTRPTMSIHVQDRKGWRMQISDPGSPPLRPDASVYRLIPVTLSDLLPVSMALEYVSD
jgi:hypothetical protein